MSTPAPPPNILHYLTPSLSLLVFFVAKMLSYCNGNANFGDDMPYLMPPCECFPKKLNKKVTRLSVLSPATSAAGSMVSASFGGGGGMYTYCVPKIPRQHIVLNPLVARKRHLSLLVTTARPEDHPTQQLHEPAVVLHTIHYFHQLNCDWAYLDKHHNIGLEVTLDHKIIGEILRLYFEKQIILSHKTSLALCSVPPRS